MSARAISSGTVSFGLVAIPVKLYSTAESSSSIRFNMIHESCGTRVKYRYYCPTHDELVDRDELAKGYEVSKGQYVLFSKEELAALTPEATNEISIDEFVPLDAVDPIYFEKAYYLGPDKGGARPYKLLARTLEESGRAALGQYAARGKEHLVLLRPFAGGLLMQQLRYEEELRPFSEVPVDDVDLKDGELELALQLVSQGATDEFHPERYEDEETKRVRALLEKKIQGEEIVAAPSEAPKAQIIDLMEALRSSLGEAEERKPAQRARRTDAAASETEPAVAEGGG